MELKQKTVSLSTDQITSIQSLANNTTNGDFSKALRYIITEWETEIK